MSLYIPIKGNQEKSMFSADPVLLKTYSLSIKVRDSLGSSVNYTLRKMKEVCSSACVIVQPQNLMHAT